MSRTRAELADHEWRATRHQAEQVDCPNPPHGCGETAGHTCTNIHDGQPLTRLPAHAGRIRKAQETTP